MGLLLAMLPVAVAVSPATVEASLAHYAQTSCGAEEVEVSWVGLAQTLPGSEEAQLSWSGDPCRGRPELRLRIVEDGVLHAQVSVRPGLAVWVRTWTAPERVLPGEDFRPVSGLVLAHQVRGKAVTEGTWRARVSLKAGQAVTTGLVVRVPDVEQGAHVSLIVVRGSLRIDAPGRLAEDGYLGENVRVVNDATKVVAEGVLVAPDQVRIL